MERMQRPTADELFDAAHRTLALGEMCDRDEADTFERWSANYFWAGVAALCQSNTDAGRGVGCAAPDPR